MKRKKVSKLAFLFIIFISIFTVSNMEARAEEVRYSSISIESSARQEYSTYSNASMFFMNDVDTVSDKIYRGLLNQDDAINIEKYNISIHEISDLYFGVLADNSRVFYTLGTRYSFSPYTQRVINIYPEYLYDKAETKQMLSELDDKVNSILGSIIKPSMSEFQKEVAIHDYIVLNTRYDIENLNNNSIPKESYTAYGVLVKGVGVCQGYAESMKMLLNEVGVECIILSAPEMNHAWNIVTLDGKTYHVDATWNDPIIDKERYLRYKHLNVSDEKMQETHYWDSSKYPSCTSDDYSYLHSIVEPRWGGEWIYYLKSGNIFKVNYKTLLEERIPHVLTYIFDIDGEWIYFANAIKSNPLCRIKTDGTQFQTIDEVFSRDIYVDGGYVYYTDYDSGIQKKIKIEIETESEPEEDYVGYKRWPEILNISPDKVWEIKFNLALDQSSINKNNVYVKDRFGNLLANSDIRCSDEKTVMVVPSKHYSPGTYYLYIESFKSESGKLLGENVKVKFTVE